jgi:hypothetical protein
MAVTVAVTVTMALAGALPGGSFLGPCLPVAVTVAVALAGVLPVSLHVTKKKIIPTKTGCLLPSFRFQQTPELYNHKEGWNGIIRQYGDNPRDQVRLVEE